MGRDSSGQRIARLTPLAAILSLIETRVAPVAPAQSALAAAVGTVLAADVVLPKLPPRPIALRDGFAVTAAALADATHYAPVVLAVPPRRIGVGEAMPRGTDAVVPFEALSERQGRIEAVAAPVAGEGVLPAGGDGGGEMPIKHAGEVLTAIDHAVMAAADVGTVSVRAPRIRIAIGSGARTPLLEAARTMLAGFVAGAGGVTVEKQDLLEAALNDQTADAVFAIGGTGTGAEDRSVLSLSRLGKVEAHGLGVAPGETGAFGFVGTCPVLLLPGRLDAVLALWVLIGAPLLARLCAARPAPAAGTATLLPLARKVASTIGLVEVVPVRISDGMAEPLGSGYLSFAALARSDGFIVVPAESEGYAAGTKVAVRPWP